MYAILKRITGSEVSGGVILILAALLAMLLANSEITSQLYHSLLNQPVTIQFAQWRLEKNLLLWINDALMAFFFLLVGLEVKRELIEGSLASRKQAVFPLLAALGGMVVPALLFLAFNGQNDITRAGWAIPVATDIAFALGVLALLGSRVPVGLKMFLLALAVIDDLGAVIVIALFYTSHLSVPALIMAALAILILIVFNRTGIQSLTSYLLVGAVLWLAILNSGVHATVAGVILGFIIPLKGGGEHAPAIRLAHGLHPWVNWIILPLFAFVNAGVELGDVTMRSLFSLLPLGIMAGLLIGKPVGITLFCWLAVKLRIAALPAGTQLSEIAAIGVLCGIGFTMSIFITSLAFGAMDAELITLAKLGILGGSLLSALLGYSLLRVKLSKN